MCYLSPKENCEIASLLFLSLTIQYVLWTAISNTDYRISQCQMRFFGNETVNQMVAIFTRVNQIAIHTTARMAADKEAVALPRVRMYAYKCILSIRDQCLFCS